MALTKRQKRKKCGRKICYNSLAEAKKAAAIFATKKKIVTFMQAYKCHCGSFHIGGTKKIDWSKVK